MPPAGGVVGAGSGCASAVGSGVSGCGWGLIVVGILSKLWLSLSGGATVTRTSTRVSSDEDEADEEGNSIGVMVVTADAGGIVGGALGAMVVSGGVTGRTVGGAKVEEDSTDGVTDSGGAAVAGAV